MQANYTESLCAALSLHLAVVLAASCTMSPRGCEAVVHEEKTFICPVFQGLLSFSQHVWFLRGLVSLGFVLILPKNIIYSHVFHLFTDGSEVAAMGKGKYTGTEIIDIVTTWNVFETKRKDPWGSTLERDYSSSDGSPHRASHLFYLQPFSTDFLQIVTCLFLNGIL